MNATCAGPTAAPESTRLEPRIAASTPSAPTVKPLILPSPPPFNTYSKLPCTVRLMGRVPPDPTRLVGDRPAGPTRDAGTPFAPALTAENPRPSSLRASAPPRPRPLPGPPPPVAPLAAAT